MSTGNQAAGSSEENDLNMREGLGAFHRAASLCSILVLAIAAPAIAEDSVDSKGSQENKNSTDSKDRDTPRARLLEKFDKDGDGKLSEDERAAARNERQEQRLEKFDADGDGKLSETEERAARTQRKARHLGPFDTDGDGKLSEDERRAAHDKRSNQHTRELEQFDADGDGKLTGEEEEQAKAARKKRPKRLGIGPNSRSAVDHPGNAPQEP